MNENFFSIFKDFISKLSNIISKNLRVLQDQKIEIYSFLYEETDITNIFYWISLLSSVGIATLGLALNSPAVIIGAMLLSPLMGPIIALGLAITIGDFYLGMRSSVNLILSIIVSLVASTVITFSLPFQIETAEVLSRTRPNTLDLGVALICGFIASISVTRISSKGASTTIPGVAIAVALIPPLCSAGFGLGVGWKLNLFAGAFLLFLTNLVSIVFSSAIVFLFFKMGAKDVVEKIQLFIKNRAARNRLYNLMTNHKNFNALKKVGNIYNRLLIVALILVVIIIPLSSILNQIKRELIVKRETQKAISTFLAETTILSKDILIGKKEVNIHFVLLSGIASEEGKIKKVEEYLSAKLGEQVNVSFIEIPNKAALGAIGKATIVATTPVTLNSSIKELNSKFIEHLFSILPESRKNELLNLSLALEKPEKHPVIYAIFLTDNPVNDLETETLTNSLSSILKESVKIKTLSFKKNVFQTEFKKKITQAEIEKLKTMISLVKYFKPTISLSAKLIIPPNYPQREKVRKLAEIKTKDLSTLLEIECSPIDTIENQNEKKPFLKFEIVY